ncbi:50S ribosomal protein L30 [Armatimonas rosea]|uniref:50S ribosomal protein L30 n=1 Tax=Armatimonas rosea TaxID=685828 RepID=A0A7W9SUQ4_ARMRO|nr:50S ribosomal protein L30 [Armatimonas rosea]MBB6053016.1 large subunit ribosomal protein L30 [Armatimonas rosea]
MALKVTLVKSPIGFEKSQGATARAMGLTRLGKTVELPDNESVQGMVFKIQHLVKVEQAEEAAK